MPAVDTELLPQLFDVAHRGGHRVVRQVAYGARAATPALVEKDNTEMLRIKKAPVEFGTAGTRTAMQEQDGFSFRISTLFPVEFMRLVDRDDAGFERLDRWIEKFVCHECSPDPSGLETKRLNSDYRAIVTLYALRIFAMAGGFAKDGAVQDQIDATIEDAVERARSRLPRGASLSECEECGAEIPEARRRAVPGVRLCVNCQEAEDREQAAVSGFNRRGSKDSQLR